MTLPDVADASASYGMPSGGFDDYLVAPTDPTTDWTSGGANTGNAGANQMIVDVAGLTATALRAWARFTGSATTPALANTNGYGATWGASSAYKPVPARTSAGVFTLTYPTTIVDPLGVTKTISLRGAQAQCEDAAGFFRAKVTASNVVTVTCTDTSNIANDFAADVISVIVW